MNRLLLPLYAFLLLANAGCTSLQQIRVGEGRSLDDYLELGDRLVVYETGGRIVDMRYVRTPDGALVGSLTNDGLESVTVRVAGIERIEAERVAVGRTAGAVIGGIVLAPIAAVGAGMSLAER